MELVYIFDIEDGLHICFNRIQQVRKQLQSFRVIECCSIDESIENIDEYCYKHHCDCDGAFHYKFFLESNDELTKVVAILNSNGFSFDRPHTYFLPDIYK